MLLSKAVARLTGSAVSDCPDPALPEAAVGADCALHATGRFLSKDGDFTTSSKDGDLTTSNLRGNESTSRRGTVRRTGTVVQH
jgi:hypothetical protein